eukprot:m.103749 g.103749  ORF g.103749 m.103749 type:complete len:260 (-) comp27515_c0_seq2:253-1032(-)
MALSILAQVTCGALISTVVLGANAETIGYYSWNWGKGSEGPPGATLGISFTGLVSVESAISGYDENASWCCPELHGSKILTLGGGNAAGVFSAETVQQITKDMDKIPAAGYKGVAYDAEIIDGASATMIPLFAASFAKAKELGLMVIITVSHSAPYECDTPADAVAFVKAWTADANVDIISPQLYSSGTETKPEFAETNSCKAAGCTWSLYERSRAKFVPSIVSPDQYKATLAFFEGSVAVDGFIQWAQATDKTVVSEK